MRRLSRHLAVLVLLASHTVAGIASAATEVRVVFVLERQRADLAALALSVSDPNMPSTYGKYWTVEDIAGTYGASNQTVEHVRQFLEGKGGVREIDIDVTRSFTSALLTEQAVVAIFGSVPTKLSPLVPPDLTGHVTAIVGAFDCLGASNCLAGSRSFLPERSRHPQPLPFAIPRAYERTAEGLAGADQWPSWAMGSGTPESCPVMHTSEGSCDNQFIKPPASGNTNFRSFTPKQLRTAYGFEASGFTGRGHRAVVLEFGQGILPDDVDRYATGFNLPFRWNTHFWSVNYDDIPKYKSTTDNTEITLDVQTIMGLAPEIDRILASTGPKKSDGQFFTYFPLMASNALRKEYSGDIMPDVISISYALCEDEWNRYGATSSIEMLEHVFQTAAAAGVTVIVASGDKGSSGCASHESPTPWAPNTQNAMYPASSPWVTAVGGTNLLLNSHNSIIEAKVWNDWPLAIDQALPPNSHYPCDAPPCRPFPSWAGGGGPSTRFAAPSWQQNSGQGTVDQTKRTIPDIAYMADAYPATLLHLHGEWTGSGGGTSQAAPIFAAAVLLLNEFREQNKKHRIGFANPLFYHWGKNRRSRDVYWDVTMGNNKIGDSHTQFTHLTCCDAGPGWDAATGWGSLLVHRAMHAFRESDGASVPLVGLASPPHHQGLVAHGGDPSKVIFHASSGIPITHPFANSISGVSTQLATIDSFNKTTGLESPALTTHPAGAHAGPGHGLSWIGLTDTDANPIWLSAMGFDLDILSSTDYHFEPATNIETRVYRNGTISLFEDADGIATEILSYSNAVAIMAIDWNLHDSGTPNITIDIDLPIGPLQIHSTETVQVDGSTPLGPYGVFDILSADLTLVPEPSPFLATAAALLTVLALRQRPASRPGVARGRRKSFDA